MRARVDLEKRGMRPAPADPVPVPPPPVSVLPGPVARGPAPVGPVGPAPQQPPPGPASGRAVRYRAPIPRKPGLFDRYWPAPTGPAHHVALAATFAVALTAALFVTVSRPGLGWLVVGAVAAAGVWLVARTSAGTFPLGRSLWAAAGLVLLAVGTVRAAGWLVALCVPTAALCGSIALAGGRSARGLSAGALAVPVAALRGLRWFVRGGLALGGSGAAARWWRLVAAMGIGAALLIVFGALFASADPAFAELLDDATPSVNGSEIAAGVGRFVVFGWGALGAAYLATRPPTIDLLTPGERRPVRRLEWLLPVLLLDGLFAAFVAVQLGALFGGDAYVRRTAGLTYAEYARRGFWQLVAVTLLTLAVIAVAARKAPRSYLADRVALRTGLGALTGLTLVVVASALARMAAYEDAYGLTRLRLLVAACEIWLGLVFVMVLAVGVRLRNGASRNGGWLARAVVGTGVAMLIGIAMGNPDRLIAERNIDRFQRGGGIDVGYLAGLSADAVPAFDRLPEPQRGCALRRIAAELRREPDAWYEYNWGRSIARRVEPPAPDPLACRSASR